MIKAKNPEAVPRCEGTLPLRLKEANEWLFIFAQLLPSQLRSAARVLLLMNYRPEYQHGWVRKTYYSQLRLDALPPENAGELLTALLGDDPALEPLKRQLVRRGNPFFIEERLVILAARIDRLPAEDKQLLQTASVIGKDIFPMDNSVRPRF